jgi:hypothetical protein
MRRHRALVGAREHIVDEGDPHRYVLYAREGAIRGTLNAVDAVGEEDTRSLSMPARF